MQIINAETVVQHETLHVAVQTRGPVSALKTIQWRSETQKFKKHLCLSFDDAFPGL